MVTVRHVVISARAANDPPEAANLPLVELRSDLSITGGSYPFDNHDFSVNWHVHTMHQLAYAFEGAVEVEVPGAHFLLPPQQAIWLPAGVPHRLRYRQVRTVSIYIEPELVTLTHVGGGDDRARILAAAPIVREMVMYAVRWRIDRERSDALADDYFAVLARLAAEWIEQEQPLHLPTSNHPVVSAVMRFTERNLADATAESVCAHVGVSTRSMRRLFVAEADMTWRSYLQRSRLLRAMALLSSSKSGVLETANAVGFDSASAFARAFAQFTGESPSTYRARVNDGAADLRLLESGL